MVTSLSSLEELALERLAIDKKYFLLSKQEILKKEEENGFDEDSITEYLSKSDFKTALEEGKIEFIGNLKDTPLSRLDMSPMIPSPSFEIKKNSDSRQKMSTIEIVHPAALSYLNKPVIPFK